LPELHIITGSNGAGKSTIGSEYLPPHIRDKCTVFDGDKLALQKQRELYATKRHSFKEAKAIANAWIEEYFNEQVDRAIEQSDYFAYEGHFREGSSWKVIDRFKRSGYSVHMVYLGLINPKLSEMRVLERALSGGHHVSLAEIDLNYHGNLWQLDRHFKILDELRIIDTSETQPKVLVQFLKNEVVFCVHIFELPDWFTTNLVNMTRYIYPKI
jgi:predicted ABC-type ATPase